MFKVVNASDTSRAIAFELWKNAPMPMVSFTKTLDVTRLVRLSRQQGLKFNMLMCWCICKAASGIKEFYLLPANGGLLQYDSLAVNVIVANKNGGINNCDIPFDDDFEKFAKNYQALTECVANDCRDITDESRNIIGTSAMTATELDSITNMWSGKYANPMLLWGKYRRNFFNVTLPVSLQFHHVQMDGTEAAQFLENLQAEINRLKV